MPTIKNMSYGPLSIARADKESLTLGPRETARITDEEFDSDDVRRHLRERQLAVMPGAPAKKSRGGKGGGRSHSDEGRGSTPSTPTPNE
jgi:hypothetical protein